MTETEKKLREKAGSRAETIIEDVKDNPDYFVMEGGADGTYGHMCFWEDFGHLMPEISRFAKECGGKV